MEDLNVIFNSVQSYTTVIMYQRTCLNSYTDPQESQILCARSLKYNGEYVINTHYTKAKPTSSLPLKLSFKQGSIYVIVPPCPFVFEVDVSKTRSPKLMDCVPQ